MQPGDVIVRHLLTQVVQWHHDMPSVPKSVSSSLLGCNMNIVCDDVMQNKNQDFVQLYKEIARELLIIH